MFLEHAQLAFLATYLAPVWYGLTVWWPMNYRIINFWSFENKLTIFAKFKDVVKKISDLHSHEILVLFCFVQSLESRFHLWLRPGMIWPGLDYFEICVKMMWEEYLVVHPSTCACCPDECVQPAETIKVIVSK